MLRHFLLVAVAASSRTRQDIERQRELDRNREVANQDPLVTRMRSVLQAQEALARREAGAEPAFRQSLVDLAAAAEAVAGELSAPIAAR